MHMCVFRCLQNPEELEPLEVELQVVVDADHWAGSLKEQDILAAVQPSLQPLLKYI